ncbi:MAG TPA: hypothetical protein VGZ68_05160 [Acidimicrobiales bacterium]|jgi:hypothetical protein|nr:hypothetical protein [Acidimicrobiales bacterium]
MAAATRAALASGVVLATLVVSLGVSVPSSSALGTSPFCKTMFTFHPVAPPTKISTTSYSKWAKAYLPFYEKLDSEAPNAKTKAILDEIVTILKYEAGSNSLKGLETYIATNQKKFAKSSVALAKAIIACAG